jgi:catechol 2,3-dioxygenase-like lactoylglutathione lyase family enzyme
MPQITRFLIQSIEIQLSEMITMIAYVTLGSNNIESAELFYSAFLLPLGYQLFKEGNGDLSYCLPKPSEMAPQLPDVYIKAPFNGKPASAGNGQMIAFEVPSQKNVRSCHSSALKNGGTSEGEPGFRPSYGAHFYVGYLRDPDGNKIAVFSNNLAEPSRDDCPRENR